MIALHIHTTRKQRSCCLEKEITQGTMPGARRRGRPRTAWMDNIKTWTGLSVEESVRMTHTRTRRAGTRKVKPIWILLKQETVIGSGISWAMQICTSLQTDNHASTPPLSFLQAGCPSCRPTNSVKAPKAQSVRMTEDKDKWREYVHGVANPRIEDG